MPHSVQYFTFNELDIDPTRQKEDVCTCYFPDLGNRSKNNLYQFYYVHNMGIVKLKQIAKWTSGYMDVLYNYVQMVAGKTRARFFLKYTVTSRDGLHSFFLTKH